MNKVFFGAILFYLVSFQVTIQKLLPLFPQNLTIASTYTLPQQNYTTPQMQWTSFLTNQSRIELSYGGNSSICYGIFQKSSKCIQLHINNTMHIIAPEDRLCCYINNISFLKRDYLLIYALNYQGVQILDGAIYDMWERKPTGSMQGIQYWATRTDQQISRRLTFYGSNDQITDYIVASYNGDPIDPKVFAIPEYCTSSCTLHSQNFVKKHPLFHLLNQ